MFYAVYYLRVSGTWVLLALTQDRREAMIAADLAFGVIEKIGQRRILLATSAAGVVVEF
jgi:hypothetical protein